jgi:Bax protein
VLSRQVKLPNKLQWQKLLDKTWFYTKIIFALFVFGLIAYGWGTFYPNKTAVAKVNTELDKFYVDKIKEMDLQEPEFVYNNDIQFVRAMHKCINYINFTTPKHLRVPYEMIIGQAALESGWGKSRFATEGNNLFGIRTWSEEVAHLLPIGVEKWPGWGVKVFASKCDSVKYYIDLLNNHSAYEKFRKLRLTTNDSMRLIKTLDKFSTTADYDKRVIRMINKIRQLEEK